MKRYIFNAWDYRYPDSIHFRRSSEYDMMLNASPGTKESLASLQDTCKSAAASVRSLYRLFDWSVPQQTKSVADGVTGSMFVFYFVPNNHIYLTVGLLAFFNGTPPFQIFKRYATGLIAWLTSSTPKPEDYGLRSVLIRIKYPGIAKVASLHTA